MLCVKVFATTLIFGILLAVAPTAAMAGNRSIPKDRAGLSNGDWYPYVISKLGALEWWSFATSATEVRREDYPSDWTYELAKQNTLGIPSVLLLCVSPETGGICVTPGNHRPVQGRRRLGHARQLHRRNAVPSDLLDLLHVSWDGGRCNEKLHPESARR